jgi:hypothetical protein
VPHNAGLQSFNKKQHFFDNLARNTKENKQIQHIRQAEALQHLALFTKGQHVRIKNKINHLAAMGRQTDLCIFYPAIQCT